MDLVCFDDIDEFATETDDEMVQLEQDLYHRLFEEYGSNPDDEDRGVGLASRLSGSDPPEMIARLIEADFAKDERVISCSASVEAVGSGNSGGVARVSIEVETSDARLSMGYAVNEFGEVVS